MLNLLLSSSLLFNSMNVDSDFWNSSFVQMFYEQSGVSIPKEIQDQFQCHEFENVSLEELNVGDLIFFGSTLDQPEKVGLYLGNDEYIHIDEEDRACIKVDSIYSAPWLYSAGRALKKNDDNQDNNSPLSSYATPYHPVEVQLKEFDSSIKSYFINAEKMPLVISPSHDQISVESFHQWLELNREELKGLISKHGALLLRDFPVKNAEDFSFIVKKVLGQPTNYIGEGSRKKVADGVYTSTEAPPNYHIRLHNELTCTNSPSTFFCFYCEIAPPPGSGQTILGRTDNVTNTIKNLPEVWNLFENRIMRYISRHPPEGSYITKINKAHKTWQEAFDTRDKKEVEKICQERGFEYKWTGDWLEVVRNVPAIQQPDKHFDFPYWFNQVHLYHMNPRLCGGVMNYMLANIVYAKRYMKPYDIEFEDGSPIPREIIYQIYDALEDNTIKFDWQEQDVLLLDNYQVMHGRAPYKGARRILVSFL